MNDPTTPTVFWSNVVFLDGRATPWSDLRSQATARWGAAEPGSRVAIVTATDSDAYQALVWFITNEVDGVVVGADRMSEQMQDVLDDRGYATWHGAPAGEPGHGQPGRVSIFTSGTTGSPKLVTHTWRTLNTLSARRSTTPHRWLVPYAIGTYAWYQMACLGLFAEEQGLIPGPAHDAVALFERAVTHRASAISATPTFWRFALAQVDPGTLEKVPIRQISLGGETVDQRILDDLHRTFPEARITHIYASTEVGACIVVTDGRAGFPAAWLDDERHSSYQLRVEDGHLHIRSRFAAPEALSDDGWINTGDLVEQRADRVFFLGRADNSMINVGGNKAYPADIEATLLSHPDVRWAQVVARRAPLIGHLAAAHVALGPGVDRASIEERLTKFCGERLPEYAVPRLWEFLDAIPMEPTLKTGMGR